MTHSFDIQIAEKYGVNEAIILNNLQFWVIKNKVNNKNEHEIDIGQGIGKIKRTWTFNSIRAFNILFPYLTSREIRLALNRLVVKYKILITGNFNQKKYDRTLWYSFVDENKWIDQFIEEKPLTKCQMDIYKTSNGFIQNVKPIPDIKQDINTDKEQFPKPTKNENAQPEITNNQTNITNKNEIANSIVNNNTNEIDKLNKIDNSNKIDRQENEDIAQVGCGAGDIKNSLKKLETMQTDKINNKIKKEGINSLKPKQKMLYELSKCSNKFQETFKAYIDLMIDTFSNNYFEKEKFIENLLSDYGESRAIELMEFVLFQHTKFRNVGIRVTTGYWYEIIKADKKLTAQKNYENNYQSGKNNVINQQDVYNSDIKRYRDKYKFLKDVPDSEVIRLGERRELTNVLVEKLIEKGAKSFYMTFFGEEAGKLGLNTFEDFMNEYKAMKQENIDKLKEAFTR